VQPPSPPDLSLHPLELRGRAHHIEIEEMVVYLDLQHQHEKFIHNGFEQKQEIPPAKQSV